MVMTCGDPTDAPTGVVVAAGTVFINKLPAAKQTDQVTGVDVHIVMVPTPGGPVPTPLPHPFVGIIDSALSTTVKIMGLPAAMVGSTASNTPPHIPTPPGTAFQKPPMNKGKIQLGSPTVFIGNGGGGGGGGGGSAAKGAAADGSGATTSAAAGEGEEAQGEDKDEKTFIEFNFKDEKDDKLADIEYEFIFPDGKSEKGKLGSDGKIRKDDILKGNYNVRFKGLHNARWGSTIGSAIDPNEMLVDAPFLEDGTSVKIEIFRLHRELPSDKIASVSAKVEKNKVKAEWTYKYDAKDKGTLPKFIFKAAAGKARTVSGVIDIGDEVEIELLKNKDEDEPKYITNQKGEKVKVVDVENDDGQPILPFTRIVVVGGDDTERMFVTDEKGKVKITGLPLGDKVLFRTAYGGKAEIV